MFTFNFVTSTLRGVARRSLWNELSSYDEEVSRRGRNLFAVDPRFSLVPEDGPARPAPSPT